MALAVTGVTKLMPLSGVTQECVRHGGCLQVILARMLTLMRGHRFAGCLQHILQIAFRIKLNLPRLANNLK